MTLLRDIIGHDEIIKTLKGALASGRVAHAYLFSGPRGVGKFTVATAFAHALMCLRPGEGDGCGECEGCVRAARGVHPDVEVIGPEGASVKMGQVRRLMTGIQFGPAAGHRTVRIVDDADTMTPEAGNAMLKTLEDPLPGVVMILVAFRPQALPPTILSRCQQFYFQPLRREQLLEGMKRMAQVTGEVAGLYASLSGGSLGKAMELLRGGLSGRDVAGDLIRRLAAAGVEESLALAGEAAAGARDGAVHLLELMILWLRDILLYNETGNPGRLINADRLDEIRSLAGHYATGRILADIGELELAKGSLSAGANVQLALEALFLRLAGKCPDTARWEEGV